MRSFTTIVKKFAGSVSRIRHINIALFGLALLLSGMAIGRTSVPKFVQEVWAAMIDGSGTVGTIPVFAASGSTIGDSSIIDDGINVSIGRPLTIQGVLTMANGSSFGISANKPLNITASSIALTGNVAAKSFSVGAGGIAVDGNITISKNSITTGSGDFTIGASGAKLILNGSEVTANGVHLGLINGRSGVLTAAIKNFVIDHPLKNGYELVHSSLEGPEIAVFYRGAGRLSRGHATITLPDYFDALTRDHTATVLLTAKGETPFLLSYDRFDEKSFVVHGAQADGEFDWEVKAARQDVPALEVERKKK